MEGNIVWGSTGISFMAIAIQYFSLWFILVCQRHRYSKLDGHHHTLQCQFNAGTSYS